MPITHAQLLAIVSHSAPLIHFGHFVEAALGINLAYTVLLQLGGFSGKKLDELKIEESIRIRAANAEDPRFNGEKLDQSLADIVIGFKRWILWVNAIAGIWAAVAGVMAIVILFVSAYYGDSQIQGTVALQWAIFLLGAVPAGLFIVEFLHCLSIDRMKAMSNQFNFVAQYFSTRLAERTQTAEQAVKKKAAETGKTKTKPRNRRPTGRA